MTFEVGDYVEARDYDGLVWEIVERRNLDHGRGEAVYPGKIVFLSPAFAMHGARFWGYWYETPLRQFESDVRAPNAMLMLALAARGENNQ